MTKPEKLSDYPFLPTSFLVLVFLAILLAPIRSGVSCFLVSVFGYGLTRVINSLHRSLRSQCFSRALPCFLLLFGAWRARVGLVYHRAHLPRFAVQGWVGALWVVFLGNGLFGSLMAGDTFL